MAGELVPLVMLPRYTTYASPADYTTIGMDVSEYQSAILNVWRGPIISADMDPTPAFKVTCEESTDQNNWTTCADTSAETAVDANDETQFRPLLRKRWFRLRITVVGDDAVVTCWCVGFLEERVR